MRAPVISADVARFFAEQPELRFTAVMFRNRLYVSAPRHWDAINMAFAGMTPLQVRHVSRRIADGKEKLLFGSALGDGSAWEWDSVYQDSRLKMYGFE